MALEIHEKNNLRYNSSVRFTLIEPHDTLPEISFNVKKPMALLKFDFINQALPLIIPSFPECVNQGADSFFRVDLGIRVPDYFNDRGVFGNMDKSNEYLKIKSKAGRQPFIFEKQKDGRYKVTMIETESNFLSYLLGLKPGHDFHFHVPVCE